MQTTEELMAISDKLSKIKKRADSLNVKTDDLNATIEHIEKELRGSGVEFWWTKGNLLGVRTVKNDEGLRERDYFVLGYARVGGEWCMAVQEWNEVQPDGAMVDEWDDSENGDPVALTRAPRRVRIEAAEHLEAFLDALHDEIVKMERMVDKANALVGNEDTSAGVHPGVVEALNADLGAKAFAKEERLAARVPLRGGKKGDRS